MKKPLMRSLAALSTTCVLLLAGCGGGGGGGDSEFGPPPARPLEPVPTTPLGSASQYEGICDADTQKKFVRSYLDQYYLWYNEIADVDPNRFSVPDYFDALLVRAPDANGLPRDRFSAVLPTPLAREALLRTGAQQSSIGTARANHTPYVPVVKTVTSPAGRRAGYIQFNEHEPGAQDDLITAFRQLQSAGVQDLVLDLRFNSGGFLYIALTAASMVTGPASNGMVFERLQYNDKRQAETDRSTLAFSGRVQFADDVGPTRVAQYPVGTELPQLGLPRVFVLASPRTCSASESIINSLRGIDVQVIRIGTTQLNEAGVRGTCGKPYGFHEKANCGLSYFPIEFKGTNAKGFGDYTTGFRHTCDIADNSTLTSAGTAADPLLAGALTFMDTGACPAGSATGVQSSGAPLLASEAVSPNRPSWSGRLLLPSQRQR